MRICSFRLSILLLAVIAQLYCPARAPAAPAGLQLTPHSPAGMPPQAAVSARSQGEIPYRADLASIRRIFEKLFPAYKASALPICASGTGAAPAAAAVFFYSPGMLQSVIEIRLLPSGEHNAFAHRSSGGWAEIVLTRGLLESLQTPSELAFVLAHEMAHIQSRHFPPHGFSALFTRAQLERIAIVHQRWELQADLSAVAALRNAGFDSFSAASVLERLRSEDMQPQYLNRHPSIDARMQLLRTAAGSNPLDQLALSE